MKLLVMLHIALLVILAQGSQAIGETKQTLTLQPDPGQQRPEGSVDQPPATLHDIAGPVDLAEPMPFWLYVIIALLLILFVLVFWWWRKRGRSAPQPVPPGVQAREKLLLAREIMKPESAVAYMELVSSILRSYIENRFHLPSTRQTTREFFRSLHNDAVHKISLAGSTTELRSCLERCDLAKFAHQTADLDYLCELENRVESFITQTDKPQGDTAEEL